MLLSALLSLVSCIDSSTLPQQGVCRMGAASTSDAPCLRHRAHARIRGGCWTTWRELHKAVGQGDVDLIAAILSGGVSPDAADHNDFGPMHVAAVTGQEAAARALIAAGATIDARDAFGFSPMLWALFNGHLSLAALLLQAKPSQASDRFDGLTPLMLAAASGDLALVAAMLPSEGAGGVSRADGSAPNGLAREGIGAHGLTPLDMALTLGHSSVQRLLRERGVSATSLRAGAAPADIVAGAGAEALSADGLAGAGAGVSASAGADTQADAGLGAEAPASADAPPSAGAGADAESLAGGAVGAGTLADADLGAEAWAGVGTRAGAATSAGAGASLGAGIGKPFEVRETTAEALELDPSIWDASISNSVPLLVHGFAQQWSEPLRDVGPAELRGRWGERPVRVAISPDEMYQCHVSVGGTTVLRGPPWEEMPFSRFLDLIPNQGVWRICGRKKGVRWGGEVRGGYQCHVTVGARSGRRAYSESCST
jgi:hypothetical protein